MHVALCCSALALQARAHACSSEELFDDTNQLGWHYLSKATRLIRPPLVCVFRRVKDHRNLLHYSPLLKNTCVRQVVLDK